MNDSEQSAANNPSVATTTTPKRRARFALWLRLVFVAVFVLLCSVGFEIYRDATDPSRPIKRFQRRIAAADRIVVRDGGFDCCGTVDGQKILFEVTDPDELREVRDHIVLIGPTSPCLCCGHPGIDWYCGDRRVALTAMHHGRALVSHDFSAQMAFSEESAEWLYQWFQRHRIAIDSKFRPTKQLTTLNADCLQSDDNASDDANGMPSSKE